MKSETTKIIDALKAKRNAEGLSIRKLSAIIGVSFSTLARIERGDGDPDNNSKLRILEWLGQEGRDSGLSFENVAFVHFRASKNVASKTVQCLLEIANFLKYNYEKKYGSRESSSPFPSTDPISFSKPEMEDMANSFRKDLGLKDSEPLDSLKLKINGVETITPDKIDDLEKKWVKHLLEKGSNEWSAMSVPLDEEKEIWVIVRNPKHSKERQRVTLLEEYWHILQGHRLTKIAKIADAYGRSFESSEEHDAYYLASATLLPESAIRKGVSDGISAKKIAKIYGTSPELVHYRIKRLGLWRQFTGKEVKLKSL